MADYPIIVAGGGGSGSGEVVQKTFTKAAHGLAINDAVYNSGIDDNSWAKAKADIAATLGYGVVSAVNGNDFTIVFSGYVNTLTGLTAGEYYYVSSATAGLLTSVSPSTYSNSILLALTTTTAIVLPWRAEKASINSITPAFSVHKNGVSQTGVTTALWKRVTWSTNLYDKTSEFASSKFTCGTAGIYNFSVALYYGVGWPSDNVYAQLAFYVNGLKSKNVVHKSGNVNDLGVCLSAQMDLVVGDYVEVYVYQTKGSDQTIGGAVQDTWFSGFLIR